VNEFPDLAADAAVNKRTLVVRLGVTTSAWVYRTVVIASYPVAAAMLIHPPLIFGGLGFLSTLPLAIIAIKSANKQDLARPGLYRASQITVLLHAAGTLALSFGFLISGLRNQPI
ncbi:MAG: prenyltransferase, partial [Planctomycetota bacterium]